MSGDVQPRRRKDKRRKKEDADVGTPPPTLVSPSVDPLAENLTIHVHKERGTGGHWCARIIFFALLAILVGLIGIILIEQRGAADVDTPIADSRWATVFDGWVDDVQLSHDQTKSAAEDNHSEEQEEEEEEEEGVSEQASEEVDEESAEKSDDDDTAKDKSEDEDGGETEDEDDQGLDSHQDTGNSKEEQFSFERETDGLSEEKEQEESKELENNDSEEISEQMQNENDEDDAESNDTDENEANDDADNAALEEVDENTSDLINDSSNELDLNIEGVDTLNRKKNDDDTDGEEVSSEFLGIPGVNEIDDNSAEPLEEVEDGEPEEIINESEIEPVVEEVEEESSSVAVKFGVGIALIVAAHFVLVRRWNNVENVSQEVDEGRGPLDLSRRNTIVPPPRVDRIIPPIGSEPDKEHISIETENYENLRSKYKKLETEVVEEHLVRNPNLARELHVEKERVNKDEEEVETEEEEEEELETSDDELNSGTEEDDMKKNEEDDEEDIIDDSALVAKLEAKYGKLPTPSESEEEEEEEEEEEQDDEELGEEEDEEEEEEEEEEDNDDDEDIQGWKRVKAPREAQSQAGDVLKSVPQAASSHAKPVPKQGGARNYETDDITNPDDAIIREELDAVQDQTAEKRVAYFTVMLSRHATSPRTRFELAKALDDLAEERKDNSYLKRAITTYESVLELGTRVEPTMFRNAAERCIDRLRFSGQYSAAEAIHKSLISRFSDEPRLRNQLAVTYLMQNKLSKARKVLQETLGRWPNDGFALVHYGFILKTGDGNMVDAIMYLKTGIESGDEGTIDGRFFFHLGDALVRLGRTEEANKVYENGAKNGLFPSVHQRSLYNVNRLTAHPWWTLEQTSYKEFFETLQNNWQIIKAEGLSVLGKNGYFKNEAENLRDKGTWQQFELFARGHKIPNHCSKTPRTCSLIEGFSPAAGCRRGQVKFSVMYPGTHVWPHCGPTNCRLRAHLGLSGTKETYIRVANETRSWQEGAVMVFDDSFEHEVWHNGTSTRLVLIVDIWHPELSESERHALPAI